MSDLKTPAPTPEAPPGEDVASNDQAGAGHPSDGEGLAPSPPRCTWMVGRVRVKGGARLCDKPATVLDWCRSHAEDEADRRFRLLIKRRDRRCRNRACRAPEASLDCAHIFTRGRDQTRWDPANAVALCRVCHTYFQTHATAWKAWVLEYVFAGDERAYGELEMRSTSTERGAPKVDVATVIERMDSV